MGILTTFKCGDTRGSNLSERELNIAILADDLLAIIDQLRANHVGLVAHSFGGYVIQEFTHRYPERVSAVGIIGCTNLAQKPSAVNRLLYRVSPKCFPECRSIHFANELLQN